MYDDRALVCSKPVKASFNEYDFEELKREAKKHRMSPATFVKLATVMALRLSRLYGGDAPPEIVVRVEKDITALEMIKQMDRRKSTACIA